MEIFTQLGQFIEEFQYVPQGAPLPAGFTHTLKVASVANGQDVVVALKVRAEFAALLDLVLSFA